jgi:hypothetical protein
MQKNEFRDPLQPCSPSNKSDQTSSVQGHEEGESCENKWDAYGFATDVHLETVPERSCSISPEKCSKWQYMLDNWDTFVEQNAQKVSAHL